MACLAATVHWTIENGKGYREVGKCARSIDEEWSWATAQLSAVGDGVSLDLDLRVAAFVSSYLPGARTQHLRRP
jgi:hypothetical protein